MSSVSLKWETATVKDATLAVELDGKLSSEWKGSFETTIRLLGHGDWGKVQLKKQAVRVSEVTPGSEEKLRHHLEGVVAQANAAVESAESEAPAGGADGDADVPDGGQGPDAEMTRSFRSFETYFVVTLMYLALALGFRAVLAGLYWTIFRRNRPAEGVR